MDTKDQENFQGAEFYIVPPGSDRKRFAVVARWGRDSTEQKSQRLDLPGIKATNRLYLEGKLSRTETIDALNHLISGLKKTAKPKAVYLKANKSLLDDYWVKVYGPREITARRSAYNRLFRAIKAVGNLPIATATDVELFQAVREFEPNPGLRKRIISTLSQLFKYIGRTDIQVPRMKKVRASVKHLSIEDFSAVASGMIDQGFALLCKSAFATGCRPGELFSLSGSAVNTANQTVFVSGQVDLRTGEAKATTKTGERRHVPVLAEFFPDLQAWIKLDDKEKERIRKLNHARSFRRALRKTLKGRKENFVLYDLRHSYAIHLLNKGIPIDLVAQALGNSVSVCQEHYLGFVLTTGGLDTMRRILNS